ncbi:MAG TPA: Uma2 family endonuclease [Chloroflexota bacterium]
MAETTRLLTADDLLALPDDGWRYELRAGRLLREPPAGGEHGALGVEALYLLKHHIRQHRLGKLYSADTGFVLARDPDTVRAPDIAFVRADRALSGPDARGFLPQAPDLAVEIVSPSERPSSTRARVEDYLRAGTRLVWVIYPTTRSVTVHRLDGSVSELREGGTLSGEEVVPGFACAVADLFAEL